MTELLSGSDLTLLRGDRCLFKRLDFALNPGELLTVEGPNGSGKTSLLRGIAGLLEFETGQVCWRGLAVRRAYQQFRAEFAWFGHRVGFKADLDLVQNLRFEATLRALDSERFPSVFEKFGLEPLVGLPMRALSAGQQRRVALARLVTTLAPLWLLDEPLTNLDRDGQGLVREAIAEHLGSGGLCVAASHQPLDIDCANRSLRLS